MESVAFCRDRIHADFGVAAILARVRFGRQRRMGFERGDHVACAIDLNMPSDGAELTRQPRGALLLEKGGRRYPAKLQVNLVHPLFLTRKPLQSLANPGRLG